MLEVRTWLKNVTDDTNLCRKVAVAHPVSLQVNWSKEWHKSLTFTKQNVTNLSLFMHSSIASVEQYSNTTICMIFIQDFHFPVQTNQAFNLFLIAAIQFHLTKQHKQFVKEITLWYESMYSITYKISTGWCVILLNALTSINIHWTSSHHTHPVLLRSYHGNKPLPASWWLHCDHLSMSLMLAD